MQRRKVGDLRLGFVANTIEFLIWFCLASKASFLGSVLVGEDAEKPTITVKGKKGTAFVSKAPSVSEQPPAYPG